MSKIVFLAIASALIGAGNGLQSFATGSTIPEGATPDPGDGGGSEEPPKRRGRPPGGAAAKPPEGAPAGDGAATPSPEDRLKANQALIKPLVDGGQGEEVKKVIAKYSKTGMKDIPVEKQAEFEGDIAALSY